VIFQNDNETQIAYVEDEWTNIHLRRMEQTNRDPLDEDDDLVTVT
jgi:hypothetical protein